MQMIRINHNHLQSVFYKVSQQYGILPMGDLQAAKRLALF
jgi:hypothetical protein